MRRAGRSLGAIVGAALAGLLLACGTKVEGTYSNVNGLVVLDLSSGGKATLSYAGETRDCSYTVDEKQVRMSCGRERFSFRRNQDGTLTGEGFLGIMKKSKS
ncbi:MAG TPA: hypothetical protein VMT11_14845 [Myxococcaceae bacterium]|nr:hypothetical protein [Myxococcaceae bacterium]